jgi:hypothetical protein
MIVAALGIALAGAACGDDLILSAYNLEVAPSPAHPGDVLVASFNVDLAPTQAHTMIVVIDGTEHLRVDSDDVPGIPVVLELGDAADLIATYGPGEHVAHVEVHVSGPNETARSGSALFELVQDTP